MPSSPPVLVAKSSFHHFFRLLWIILSSDRFSTGSYLVLIALSCLYEYLATLVGTSLPLFYKVLLAKDSPGFYQVIWKCIGLFFGISLVKALSHLASGLFSLFVRQRLSERCQRSYVSQAHLYHLANGDSTLDHPDQRITQDIERYSTDIGRLIESVVIAPGLLVYYTYQVTQFGGFWAPVAIYSYFLLSYIVSQGLLRPIVPLIYHRERCEGDFRFLHVRLRNFAESISLLSGYVWERTALNQSLGRIVQVQKRVLVYELFLRFWSVFVSYFGSAISYIGIGIPIFNGTYDNVPSDDLATLISQNLFYSLYLINVLTNISDLSDKMMGLLGYATRIMQLLDKVEENETEDEKSPVFIHEKTSSTSSLLEQGDVRKHKNDTVPDENSLLVLSNVSVSTPSGSLLVRDLDLQVRRADHILIHGPSGSGKSSLMRVLAGLWKPFGNETYPPVLLRSFDHPTNQLQFDEDATSYVLFLSQIPYLACCEPPYLISQQVVYPSPLLRTPEELKRVKQALAAVDLEYLLDRFEGDDGYSKDQQESTSAHDPISQWDLSLTLSGGEQQRLCLARLFYHVPRLAILDEALSHLPISQGNAILSRLRQRYPNMSILAFSHLPLNGFEKVLTLTGNEHGDWRME